MSKPVLPPGSSSKREPVTPVVFRRWPKSEGGGIIALFPGQKENNGLIDSYEHNGGHASASPELVYRTKKVTKEEYEPLKRELERIGYNLKVMSRVSRRMK
jgi:hypothetical protein